MEYITVRHAKLNELPRIIYITKLAYKVPYKKDILITGSNEPKDVDDKFKKKEFFIIIAIVNNKIVGAVRYKIDQENNLYFYKLAILKTFRNKGISAALINELEKTAKKKGCDKILLDCAKEKKLPDYYKKFGFKIDKIKKHLDHHDVFMSKKV